MKVIPRDLASAFPFAFLAFWSAFRLSAPSFLPASRWKLFFSWLKRSAGSSQTIQGQCEAVSPSRRRRNLICQIKKWLMCFFNTWHIFWLLKHTGITEVSALPSLYTEIPELLKCQCTAITKVHSLLLMSSSTSTFSPSCSFKNFKRTIWKVLTFTSREACPGAFFMSVSIVSSILSSQNGKPHVIRKVESLALPLVCHLVGITNASHLKHTAFNEHSGKTFSLGVHVTYLHLHCWHDNHKFVV